MTHSLDQLKSAHQSASQCARVLRLPFRAQSWRGQAGDLSGSGVGSSIDFQDHRLYVPGDDPRHLNWQAYARTGQHTMKLYREEVSPLVDLIFDVSESMFISPEKTQRSLELFYFFVESTLRSGATPHCHLLSGGQHRPIPFESILSHQWPALIPTDNKAQSPLQAHLPLRANSLRVFLSDLLYPGDPSPLVTQLGHNKGRGLIFAPFCQSESAPDWHGAYEFVDAETQHRQSHLIDHSKRQQYQQSYQRHFDLWKAAARKQQVALIQLPSSDNLHQVLTCLALPTQILEPCL